MHNTFTVVRVVAALLTVLAIFAKPYIPKNKLDFLPNPRAYVDIYGSKAVGGSQLVSWINKSQRFWRCNFLPENRDKNCGITVVWNQFWDKPAEILCPETPPQAATQEAVIPSGCSREQPFEYQYNDFSRYDGIEVKVHYEGLASFIRVYLINVNPNQQTGNSVETGKFMSTLVSTAQLRGGPVYIPLTNFQVEEWWALKYNPGKAEMRAEFDHIVTIAFDQQEFGIHRMRLDSIKLVGERISDEAFLTLLMVLWVIYIIFEVTCRYLCTLKIASQKRANIQALANDKDSQQRQRKNAEKTDTVTGVCNRYGLDDKLCQSFGGNQLPAGVCLCMLEIDHLKKINDSFGDEVDEAVIQTLVKAVQALLHPEDIFVRWSGSAFLVITAAVGSPQQYAQTIVKAIKETQRGERQNMSASVSMGVVQRGEASNFDSLFKLVEQALNKAKHERNTIVYDIQN